MKMQNNCNSHTLIASGNTKWFDQHGIQFLSFIFLIFYLFVPERHRERGRDRQREKQVPCWEPVVVLDPGTLGS